MNTGAPQPASGRVIHRRDLAGSVVEIREDGRCRWLTTDGDDIQTAMELASPPRLVLPNHRYMMAALGWIGQPQRVLNLGFGGGAFERFLRAVWPQLALESVECDPGMVDLARQYFLIPPDWTVDISNAFDRLRRCTERYDLILIDVFTGQRHAASLYDEDFYASAAQRLATGGVVAVNLSPQNDAELLELLLLMRPHFRAVRLCAVPQHGNVVVLLGAEPISDEDFNARAQALDRNIGIGLAGLCASFHTVPAPVTGTCAAQG